MPKHISETNRQRSEQKIQRKLDGLKHYIENGVADFPVPKKFTLNWFAALAFEPYESVSKASDQLRTGSATHERVIASLASAQVVLENGRAEQGICLKSKRISELETKVKKYETMMPGLSQTIVDLLDQVRELEQRISLQQAQWTDNRFSASKITGRSNV
ncbi:hypothetical protein ACFW0H_02550 [Pseudomonas sp. CR3202]|uniref:hypothetical protein n=1 Tax=Pseudomonas sp. CR3202 TaxID=3351532 RepID=UPI003BF13FD0